MESHGARRKTEELGETPVPLSPCPPQIPHGLNPGGNRLRWLVACLSQRRPGFAPGSVHVGFVVDKLALGQVFFRALLFRPSSVALHVNILSGG
jgi:hypothetical protein